jgi:CBS domain containing-hemolysin-like protein
MMKRGLSRLPVIEESVDNVVGIAYVKDVVAELQNSSRKKRTAGDVGREPTFVPESKKVAELLAEMRNARTHMMVVMDEYGGVAGLVTLEDLLEEIVGEIADEYDIEVPQIEEVDERTFRVDAALGIDELNHRLHVQLPHDEWDSVGGLIGGTLGRVASVGDAVSVDGLKLEVEKTKGRRIASVLVERISDVDVGGSP